MNRATVPVLRVSVIRGVPRFFAWGRLGSRTIKHLHEEDVGCSLHGGFSMRNPLAKCSVWIGRIIELLRGFHLSSSREDVWRKANAPGMQQHHLLASFVGVGCGRIWHHLKETPNISRKTPIDHLLAPTNKESGSKLSKFSTILIINITGHSLRFPTNFSTHVDPNSPWSALLPGRPPWKPPQQVSPAGCWSPTDQDEGRIVELSNIGWTQHEHFAHFAPVGTQRIIKIIQNPHRRLTWFRSWWILMTKL